MVYIHPQSQLYLDLNNASPSVLLPPFADAIRFCTRTGTAFKLMIEPYLDPPSPKYEEARQPLIQSIRKKS